MRRIVQPEFLDLLPADHPVARRNRRDLLLFNRIMGNCRWMRRALDPVLQKSERILEIGAGDGALRRSLAPLIDRAGARWDGLDVCARPSAWPQESRWIQCRIQEFDAYDAYDVVVAGLILHQLHDDELRALGGKLNGRCRVIVAAEPARRKPLLWKLSLTALLGVRAPSRHDARASIAAGFQGDEIARLLNLSPSRWTWHSEEGPFGSHRFRARRNPAGISNLYVETRKPGLP